MYLDENLKFNYHIKEKMAQAMKTIGIIKNLSTVHPQHCLITICKSYLKPHLDYGILILFDLII